MRSDVLRLAALALVVGAPACDQSGAFGDAESIIVAARPDLWTAVEDTVQSVLEPRIFTVRRERTFTLTYQDPTAEPWGRLRQFRQELVIGSRDDPWVAEALAARDDDEPLTPPAIAQAQNVWARNQLATILVLPEDGQREALLTLLEPLHDLLDRQYRDWTVQRMFVSGRDTALADTLQGELGFRLLVPRVYRWSRQDSVIIFRNDNPDPSELIRQVTVSWRSPIPDALPTDSLLAWRTRIAVRHYSYPQVIDTTRHQRRSGEHRGMAMREIQAVWANPPEDDFPAGGPFILRAVRCEDDDRLYLLDAWLYAPNREKYQYMLQLDEILDSFRC